ncbi:MAG: hypothetical protein ABF242_10620 [Flavobacteriales bacterium]
MSTIELKNKLHSLIDSIGDNEKLQAMLIFMNNSTTSDWWDEMSDDNKNDIEEGLNDLKKGNIYSDKEVRNNVRKRIIEARKK